MKNTSLKSRYYNNAPIGCYAMTNNTGILFYLPDTDDEFECDLICAWYCGDTLHSFHKHRVYYSPTGRAYIRKSGARFYLDNATRV